MTQRAHTIDGLTMGSESGFGKAVRTARTTEEWAQVHREASAAFEARYDEETEAIRSGTPPSAEFLALEVIVTLTHEVLRTRRGIQRFINELEG
jgi:hypothetical protein